MINMIKQALCGNDAICIQRDGRTIHWESYPIVWRDWEELGRILIRFEQMTEEELDNFEMENAL